VTASTRRARSPCATAPSSCTSASGAATAALASCSSSPTETCGSSTTTASYWPSSPSTRPRPTKPRNDPDNMPNVVRDVPRHPSVMSRDTTQAEGVGFEPTGSLHPQGFSRASHSAALPSLQAVYQRRISTPTGLSLGLAGRRLSPPSGSGAPGSTRPLPATPRSLPAGAFPRYFPRQGRNPGT
jgi:hypothetical protein